MNDDKKEFGFEIDFLPVGNGEDSGDAICMRWGYGLDTVTPDQFVMVVDGGYKETAKSLVTHLKTRYFNGIKDPLINLVVSTHPHQDHISGLAPLIDECKISGLMMAIPWEHEGLKKWFAVDHRLTESGIHNRLKSGLDSVRDLTDKLAKGKHIFEAFAPWKSKVLKGCEFHVLGPSKSFYESMLPDFNATPGHGLIQRGTRLVLTGQRVSSANGKLNDEGETSAENESSLILLIHIIPQDKYILLTADAGKLALCHAIKELERLKIDINKIDIVQVPHHGSVQNVTPGILNAILGVPLPGPQRMYMRKAVVSVSENATDDHPSDTVRNAVLERGVKFKATQGSTLWFYYGVTPQRPEFSKIEYDVNLSESVCEYST